ncbi:MAG: hypothetical protein ACRDSP_09705 [Pseudonocardiaceae bacterium]
MTVLVELIPVLIVASALVIGATIVARGWRMVSGRKPRRGRHGVGFLTTEPVDECQECHRRSGHWQR